MVPWLRQAPSAGAIRHHLGWCTGRSSNFFHRRGAETQRCREKWPPTLVAGSASSPGWSAEGAEVTFVPPGEFMIPWLRHAPPAGAIRHHRGCAQEEVIELLTAEALRRREVGENRLPTLVAGSASSPGWSAEGAEVTFVPPWRIHGSLAGGAMPGRIYLGAVLSRRGTMKIPLNDRHREHSALRFPVPR
jgi:hypothetical protein